MTVNEIYQMLGSILNDGVSEDFKCAYLFIDRLDKYVSAKGEYINGHGELKSIDNLQFGFTNAIAVHELHGITTEDSKNRWNKLKFLLYPTGKFELDFIWDQEYQDAIDKLNQEL